MTLNNLVAEYGSPYSFYRSVYNGTACGPTIGMRFKGSDETIYNRDLPREESVPEIEFISVSSIVEGSDVEIDARIVDRAESFWGVLVEVDEEAKFYWERDNSVFLILAHETKEDIFVSQSAATEEYSSTNQDLALAQVAISAYLDGETTVTYNDTIYGIEEYYPDYDF